ncbi:hypothetical protein WAI453_000975 [Rhynchosporium graminicola]|uniref:Related to tpa inducible protein n=1 Tax=Rhynchosporium graminicola TaxID=2792576 RepID=A0A1E1K5L0_9HELO|nr:related to tpa inducible protein [Rhynchosporium commune]
MDPFQQMGGGPNPAQIMAQQQQQQQRLVQGGGGGAGGGAGAGGAQAPSQIQSMIFSTLQQQTGALTGWRTQVLPNERMGLIFNVIGNLRLASQNQPNPTNLSRMIEIAMKFEKDLFDKCQNKDVYKQEVQMKLEQLLERRSQNQASMQQQIHQQAHMQAQNQQAQAQQQMLMNQNNMSGQGPRVMPPQPPQQGFSHLQRQMQASPLSGQQPPQAPMGLPNQGPPQNMAQNQQQFVPMPQQQNLVGRPNNGQQLTQQDNAVVNELTSRLMAQANEDDKNNLRVSLQQRMDPAQLTKYQAQGVDPVFIYYRNQAIMRLRNERGRSMQQAQAQQQQQQQLQNVPVAPQMQPQRSMNPSPMNGQALPPTSGGGNQEFGSFMGNMENLVAQQQQQGVLAQEAGQMVVPASVPPRNGTPQPGMAGQGIDMVPNPNSRAQQQQQIFNAQQIQQQRMQHAQQQQQQHQTQVRLNAQQKAQQSNGLRGQPGGMGPGPNPPQQSPAMATLNAPLRGLSQPVSHPEPQVNPNAQFGQPLDPRFMQGNRPSPANGMTFANINPAMLQNMPPEAQRTLANLPPEKLNEVVKQWHETRNVQMNAANMAGGRPQMSMQGLGQVRPGQQMPPGPFNPQNGGNQFMMGNPGQRPSQPMAAGMNPQQQQQQQQQMVLQQQMANLRENQMQPRGPQNAPQLDQRTVQGMDNIEVPQVFLNHASMPQGSPPEVKKWGQLKQWVSQNPMLAGTNSLEAVKQLQRMHYAQAVRNRQGQNGMQAGVQGHSSVAPNAPVMVAPVAPMNAVNSANVPGAGQIRQPTAQDILTMRTHPSGRFAQATDDQIRTMFMKQQHQQLQQRQGHGQEQGQGQMTPQQHQQRQQIMASQLSRMQQASGQPPHMTGQPNLSQAGQVQTRPGQVPKQNAGPQPNTETGAALTNPNSNRPTSRAQPNARNAAQSSPPPQAPKNLKRASSDDVIEVPNPNAQQPSLPVQEPVQQPRQQITQQQVAAMDPETRKRYENALRNAQNSNQGQKVWTDRLAVISREEQAKLPPTLPEIPMDEELKKKTAKALMSVLPMMNNVSRAMTRLFVIQHDEPQLRRFLQARFRYAKQFRGEFAQPNPILRDNLSIGIPEVENIASMLAAIVQKLSAMFPNMKKPDGAAKNQQASAPQGELQHAQPAQPPTPLNAANLHQQQQQLSKLQHQRSNSRNSNTPAAPTSSQPPFPLGATSPHGTPAYAGKNPLKQEDLHIPARKKQKQYSTPVPGQITPGSNPSPQVSKAVSPDMKRQPSDIKQRSKPSLCCSEPECDRHNVGFESPEALKAHTQEEHIRPLENPFKYVQENLATALGLDEHGQLKKPATSGVAENGESTTKMTSSDSRQGQTPDVKGESTSAGATPMNRQVSMTRQGSVTGVKTNLPPKSVPPKDTVGKAQPGQKDATRPKESQAEAAAPDPWANSIIDPHDLFQSFQPLETGAGGAISDMNVYRSITPNDTPESSKDGISEPNSDITDGVALDISLDMFDDAYNPFGPIDDGLFDMSGFGLNCQDDVPMFDVDPPAVNYHSWDDLVDPSVLDKPFSFETGLFSMDANYDPLSI